MFPNDNNDELEEINTYWITMECNDFWMFPTNDNDEFEGTI